MRGCQSRPGWYAALIVAVALLCASAGAVERVAATIDQPRGFGYLIGDVMSQRIALRVHGYPFEPAMLPPLERTGAWLERRAAKIETDANGQRWLSLEYQVINAPPALTVIALPALTLRAHSAAGPLLTVAAWPVSIAPITPQRPVEKGDLGDLQPDRAAVPLPTLRLRQQLLVSLAAVALVLCAWAGWWVWRNYRDARRLPFARAFAELARLDAARVDDEPQAWRYVHQALNQTAGQTVHAGSLEALFERAPYLRPLSERVERFYAQSEQRFFATAAVSERYALLELCRDLRHAERRHNR
jgi:mxaA protein